MRQISRIRQIFATTRPLITIGLVMGLTSTVFPQVAPVVPQPVHSKAASARSLQTQPAQGGGSAAVQQSRKVALERADEALKRGDFDEAIFFFQLAVVPPRDWKSEEDTLAYRGLIAAYSGKGDMETTLYYASEIAKRPKFSTHLVHMVIGSCYRELLQPSAAIDFLRLAASLSEDVQPSQILAMSLVQTPIPSIRDGQEAMYWLADQRELAERDPRVSKLIALASAENGDFEQAIAMQRRLIDRVPTKDRAQEIAYISQYENKQKSQPVFPAFDRRILSRDKLAEQAWKSTVHVNVSGLASDGLTDEESTIVKVVKYRHMGIALNKMGSILISSESTELPHMVEGDLKSPRAKRWVKQPTFSVWAIVDSTGVVLDLGKASIVGVDHESGLAVIQCDRIGHEHDPIPELQPARFQPEHRSYDPAWLEFSKSYFERNDSTLVERTGGGLETRSYPMMIENPQVSGTTAQFVECDQSRAPIGAPLLNVFGECIGLVRSIQNPQTQKVAVPAAVCSRIASKLCAFGFVPRVHSPMVVSSVSETSILPTGKVQVLRSGMYVSQLSSQNATLIEKNSAYQKLVGNVILSVDGHPTPTNTEWLIALERIACAGWQGNAINLEVVDSEWNNPHIVLVKFAPAIGPTANDSSTAIPH